VNFLTGDVRQGDANNANTGQANQQHNTQIAVQKAAGPKAGPKPGCEPGKPGGQSGPTGPPSTGGQSVKQHQGNWSKQKQIQFIPIAPQANLQNVNVFTFGWISQGDVNNANTGQANQQHNTQFVWQQQRLLYGAPSPA
jgi:hypothetical protein